MIEAGIAVAAIAASYVLSLSLVHPLGRRWLAYWHGVGAPHQHQFYRCHACRRIITWRRIRTGGCPCRESYKISPAMLRWQEKARILWLPWTV